VEHLAGSVVVALGADAFLSASSLSPSSGGAGGKLLRRDASAQEMLFFLAAALFFLVLGLFTGGRRRTVAATGGLALLLVLTVLRARFFGVWLSPLWPLLDGLSDFPVAVISRCRSSIGSPRKSACACSTG
jgi:hypothetical protein